MECLCLGASYNSLETYGITGLWYLMLLILIEMYKFSEMEGSLWYMIDQIFTSSASIDFHVRKCKAGLIILLSPAQ